MSKTDFKNYNKRKSLHNIRSTHQKDIKITNTYIFNTKALTFVRQICIVCVSIIQASGRKKSCHMDILLGHFVK